MGNLLNSYNLNIYPNPSTGKIYIKSGNIFNGSLYIYNILGNIIINDEDIILEKDEIISYNLSKYTNGIYFIKLVLSDKIINHKLILK